MRREWTDNVAGRALAGRCADDDPVRELQRGEPVREASGLQPGNLGPGRADPETTSRANPAAAEDRNDPVKPNGSAASSMDFSLPAKATSWSWATSPKAPQPRGYHRQ